MEIIQNKIDLVSAVIVHNENGYSVSLLDDESGLTVPSHYIKIKTHDEATMIAKKIANIKEV